MFVESKKGKFYLDEKEFRFIGTNMYELSYMDPATSDKMLEDALNEGFKVVRFWAFEPLTAEKLNEICDTAGKYDIKLIPVLADKWGYMQDFVIDDEWFKEGYKNSYLEYAAGIVSALKDREEILLWELINEPESDSFEVFYDFVRDASSVVKREAPNHLLSIGTIGGIGSKFGGHLSRFKISDFKKLYSLPELDAVSIHDYSFDAGLFERLDMLSRFKGRYYSAKFYERVHGWINFLPGLLRKLLINKYSVSLSFPFTLKWLWKIFVGKNLKVAGELGKPLYLGEIGYKNNLGLDRKKILEMEIEKYFARGISGYLLWSFEAQGWSKDGHNYGFDKRDGFAEVVKKWNRKLKS